MAIKLPVMKQPPKTAQSEEMAPLFTDKSNLVHAIENLSAEAALEHLHMAQDEIDQNYFIIGGVLLKIKNQGWFKPHKSMEAYVEAECGFSGRKARYLMSIYETLANIAVPNVVFTNVCWSKMRVIAKVLTAENAGEWAKLAASKSRGELAALVKAAMASKTEGADTATEYKSRTFKLPADQLEVVDMALEIAKAKSGTEHDGVALYYLCLDATNAPALVDRISICSMNALRDVLEIGIKRVGQEECVKLINELYAEEPELCCSDT